MSVDSPGVSESEAMSVQVLREAALAPPLAADRNPALVYLARLGGETSATTMLRVLRRVATTLASWTGVPAEPWHRVPWHALRYQHVSVLRAQWVRQGLRARTVAQYLAAVRGVIDEAENLKLIAPDDARLARKVRAPRVPTEDLAGRAVGDAELAAMFAVCDGATLRGRRDRALLALLFGGGLRRREAARLRIEDVDAERGELRVQGKGRKNRTVPLSADALAAVEALRATHPLGAKGPLLVSLELNDPTRVRARLTPSGVWSVLRTIAARAGVKSLTPHDARRTRITRLLLAGEALPLVQRIAGHESVDTTGRYARTDADDALAAARRVPMTAG